MILNRLKMKRFKRFLDEEITFPEGIVGVIGENGAGKSSILEAIVFALYGVQGTCVESDFILSSAANPKDKTEVTLEFEVNGEQYTVQRTFKKAKTIHHDAHIYHGEILIADSVSGVADAIVKILGMTAADLQHTVYSGQSDLKSIISATPSVRKEWFLKVIGVSDLKKYGNEILKTEIDNLEVKISMVDGFIRSAEEKNIPDLIRNNNLTLTQCRSVLDEAENKLRGLNHTKTIEIEPTIKTCKELSTKYNSLFVERSTLMQQFNNLLIKGEEEGAALIALEDEIERISTLKETYDKHEKWLKDYSDIDFKKKTYDLLEKEMSNVKDKIKRTHDEIGGERISLEAKKEEIFKLSGEMKLSGERVEGIKGLLPDLDEILKGEEACTKLHMDNFSNEASMALLIQNTKDQSPVDLTKEIVIPHDIEPYLSEESIAGLESDIENLNTVIMDLSGMAAVMKNDRSKLEDKLKEVMSLEGEAECPTCTQKLGDNFHSIIERIEKEIVDARTDEQRAFEELNSCKSELDAKKATLADATSLMTLLNLKGKLDEYTSEWIHWGELVKQSSEELKKYEAARKKHDDLENERSILNERLSQMAGRGDLLRNQIETLENHILQDTLSIEESEKYIQVLSDRLSEVDYDAEEYDLISDKLKETKSDHDLYADLPVKKQVAEHRGASVMRLNEECAQMDIKINSLTEDIDRLNYDPDTEAELIKTLTEIEELIKENNDLKITLSKDIEALESNNETLERESMEIARRKGERDGYADQLTVSKMTRTTLNGFLEYLLTLIRGTLEDEMNGIINDVTNGRYTRIEITDSFEILVEDITGLYPVSRFSGGEQDVIAVAMRIAVSRFIANLHQIRHNTFLIFDEIFGSQDPSRRGNLIQSLRNQAMKFPQILLISHIPDIQEEFENTIEVTRNGDKVSKIKCTTI